MITTTPQASIRISRATTLGVLVLALVFVVPAVALVAQVRVTGAYRVTWQGKQYRLHIGQQPEVVTQVVTTPVATMAAANEREQFALDLLAALGNTQPTVPTIEMIVEWTLAEDHGSDASSRNNLLNTTLCGHNFIGAINSDGACGVGHYATYQDGLEAIVDTLDQSNFIDIAIALQNNDPELAKQTLWASGWASSHYNYGAGWPSYTMQTPAAPAATTLVGSYAAPPLQVAGTGCLEPNVTSAHNNSPGLQHVVIPPGADWSFNENWVIADQTRCPGQDFVGGGVCNQASRYSNVAHALGLHVDNQYHGYVYDSAVPQEDNLAIMSSGGRGGQDLVIFNPTDQTVVITAVLENGQLFVSGGFSN